MTETAMTRLDKTIHEHLRCRFSYRLGRWSCGAELVGDGTVEARAAHIGDAVRDMLRPILDGAETLRESRSAD